MYQGYNIARVPMLELLPAPCRPHQVRVDGLRIPVPMQYDEHAASYVCWACAVLRQSTECPAKPCATCSRSICCDALDGKCATCYTLRESVL